MSHELFLASVGSFWIATAPTLAQEPPVSADFSAPHVYVVTVDPGHNLLSNWGHSALWIADTSSLGGRAYSYGYSDTHRRAFAGQVLRGHIRTRPGAADFRTMLERYASENRTVWVQELNLTATQKRDLQERLEEQVVPEAPTDLLHFFRNNCSTGVRDILDEVVGGSIRRAMESFDASRSLRSHALRYTNDKPLLHLGLALVMGRSVDRQISAWDEMFLPETLREGLEEVVVRDTQGRERPLVTSTTALYRSDVAPTPGATLWPRALAVTLVLASLMLVAQRLTGRIGRWLDALLWWTALVWYAGVGVLGVALALLWAVTAQDVAYANENLLYVSPVACAVAFLMVGSEGEQAAARLLATCVTFIAFTALALRWTPLLYQENDLVIVLTLPFHVAATALLWSQASAVGNGPAMARRHDERSTADIQSHEALPQAR